MSLTQVANKHRISRASVCRLNNIKDATADYEAAAKISQEQLKNELGLETALEKVPDALLMIPKWVICKED